jgi:hypothetical protein
VTDLAQAQPLTPTRTPLPVVSSLGVGVFGGAALGIAARAWMRLISEDPEFSWSGTLFIVIGFTVFGFGQSIVAVTRSRLGRRWKVTCVRAVGAVTMLPLFVGAGSIMFPTVIGGGLAVARTQWRVGWRIACAVLAAVPVVFVGFGLVGSFGWSLRSVAGFVSMLAVYGTIIWATRFTMVAQRDGWRMSRRTKLALVIGIVVLTALPVVSSIGIG